MSQNILIPLDGSRLAEGAVSYVSAMVAKLAPEERVKITLLHVVTSVRHSMHFQGGAGSVSIPYSEEELHMMRVEAKKYLEKVAQGVEQNKEIIVDCMVSVNENPAEAIIKAEQEVNADLVAISTHGRSGLSRFAMGSVADKVMRRGTVPVLMVKATKPK